METKAATPVPDSKPQIIPPMHRTNKSALKRKATQQISAADSEVPQQIPVTCPASKSQVTQSKRRSTKPSPKSQAISPMSRQIKSESH
jgi:hypothetical protein